MFGKLCSAVLISVVACCPIICGSAPLLHHHADSAPTSEAPHSPHDSCTFDQCFCNGPSVPTHGPAYDLPAAAPVLLAYPFDGVHELVASSGYLVASDRPPRSANSDRSLPLLI